MSAGLPEIPPLELDGDVKACCAQLYGSEAVRWLLGDELHPGGARLTLRAAELAGLRAGERLVDVACGNGASVRLLADSAGVEAVGVDLGAEGLRRGRDMAASAGLGERVSFVAGDAEALPFADASFDVALSECSVCTFPDKDAALREIARVLRPGGRLALTDMTADTATLPEQLRTAAARVACVADALTEDGYVDLLERAGFTVTVRERRDDDLLALVDRVEARLRVARMIVPPGTQRERAREAVELTKLAAAEVRRGTLGYVALAAELR